MSYPQLVTEDRRLVILKLLDESDGFEANEHLLLAALRGFGHHPSSDQLVTDLAWLQEQGLIETRELGEVTVARINGRGHDVAAGRAHVPGVKRPAPGD